jgi:lysophospholipase L1-like esterase
MPNQDSRNQAASRRHFLKSAVVAGASVGISSSAYNSILAEPAMTLPFPRIKKNQVILLQGDSITDAGRDRRQETNANDSRALGKGYAFLLASELLAKRPNDGLKIYNRGISGHKVFQLAERWDKDCLDLKPDILSILIGVNDIWHALNGHYNGTIAKYEKDYRALLQRTLEKLPQVTLMICEPFVLRCGAVNDKWFPEFLGYRKVARKMAEEFKAIYVPFQAMFDEAVKNTPAHHWAGDGVHPSMAGAFMMAQTWLNTLH